MMESKRSPLPSLSRAATIKPTPSMPDEEKRADSGDLGHLLRIVDDLPMHDLQFSPSMPNTIGKDSPIEEVLDIKKKPSKRCDAVVVRLQQEVLKLPRQST
ncbi:hypothetical protein Tco_0319023 [Tanacetum coccineum]